MEKRTDRFGIEKQSMSEGVETEQRESRTGKGKRSIILLDIIASLTPSVVTSPFSPIMRLMGTR